MMGIFKQAAGLLGLAISALLMVLALMAGIIMMFSGFIVGPVLIVAILLAPAAVLLVELRGRWQGREVAGAPAGPVPVMAGDSAAPEHVVAAPVRARRPRLGWVDVAVLAGVAALIAAEAAAAIGGLGPIVAIVALGYALVLGLVYWLYRHAAPAPTEVSVAAGAEARAPVARRAEIFAGLSDWQAARVISLGRLVQVPAGEALARAGEPGDQFFIIIRGQAQLSAHSRLGEITVRIAGPGESFPLAVLIGPGTMITSARAMTDMEVLAIPRSRLLALFSQEPEIGMHIYAAVAEVLGNRYRRTLAHLTHSAEQVLKEADFFVGL